MERVAVFVDAGYLLARGAEALTGSRDGRRTIVLDEARAVDTLISFAESKAGLPGGILRVYWYDAAGPQPTAEHIRLADLDNCKLRLGTINSVGQQKGVDSLIMADMIELARNRAAASFLLVGGDEDLLVGVQVAQSHGIRVHLLGIAVGGDAAQAASLTREVDTTNEWTVKDLAGMLGVRPTVVHAPPTRTTAKPARVVEMVEPAPDGHVLPAPVHDEVLQLVVREFYDSLLEEDIADIQTVLTASGNIPKPHDGRLLARTGTVVGRDLIVSEKREMRRLFRELLEEQSQLT